MSERAWFLTKGQKSKDILLAFDLAGNQKRAEKTFVRFLLSTMSFLSNESYGKK